MRKTTASTAGGSNRNDIIKIVTRVKCSYLQGNGLRVEEEWGRLEVTELRNSVKQN